MFRQERILLNNILMLLDAFGLVLAGYMAFCMRRYLSHDRWLMPYDLLIYSIILIILVNNYIMGRTGLYKDTLPSRFRFHFWMIFRSLILDFLILGAFIFALKKNEYSRLFFLFFFLFSFIFVTLNRFIFIWYCRTFVPKRFHCRNLLIVGDKERADIVDKTLREQISFGHKIVGRLVVEDKNSGSEVLGKLEKLPEILRHHPIDEVIFAVKSHKTIDIPHYVGLCRKMGIDVRILPGFWSSQNRLQAETVQGIPFLVMRMTPLNMTGLLYKRILDIIGGLIGTTIFLLIYPFVAIAIKLDSPGPVLFKQKRVGQHGRIFTLYKFRTMYVDAEERKKELMKKNIMKGPIFKIENDPRITRVGRFLRRTSLDEFPQFWNVLKGEMSLVGTRPPTPEEVEQYDLWHWRRIAIKPGITGLWQISGRNKITDFDKIVELDCKYIENWRFLDDIKIILKTIVVVLSRKGAL